MSLLAVIPARGGSKGILGKNIKLLSGKPLIAWTIDAAKQAQCIDRIIVSTDDPKIKVVAEKCGARRLRDQHIQRRLQFEKLDGAGQRAQQRADGKTGRDNHAQLFSPAGHHQRPAGHDQQSRPTQVQRTRQRLPEIR